MKVIRHFGFAALGIGALSCAVVLAGPQQETAKQPVKTSPQPNYSPSVVEDGQNLFDPNRVHTLWGHPNSAVANYQHQSSQLAHKYVKAEKEEEKKEIRKQLTDVLAKQFDAQVERQQKELADLEKQIAGLKALLKKRTDAKTTIIDRRKEQLIQDADGLGWNAPADSNWNLLQHANPYINAFPDVVPKKP
jgi:hypothetical protein